MGEMVGADEEGGGNSPTITPPSREIDGGEGSATAARKRSVRGKGKTREGELYNAGRGGHVSRK